VLQSPSGCFGVEKNLSLLPGVEPQPLSYVYFINVENVNLRGYKWNKTVSNRIRYVSNRICNVSNEMCNTCAPSYVTADNSRPMAYLILKVI
jgi:hypothetical protein